MYAFTKDGDGHEIELIELAGIDGDLFPF
jgi:hypothetical protein